MWRSVVFKCACPFSLAALNTSTPVVKAQVHREPVSIPRGTWMVQEQRFADHQVDMLMWETDASDHNLEVRALLAEDAAPAPRMHPLLFPSSGHLKDR